MLKWFRSKHQKSASPQAEIKAYPLGPESKPVHKDIYIYGYKTHKQKKSSSVKLLNGFCHCCNQEKPRLLAVNHVAALFGCSSTSCVKKLVKVKLP